MSRVLPFRIFGDLTPIEILDREGEALGLDGGIGEAADGH
jgi:hypothetical protein